MGAYENVLAALDAKFGEEKVNSDLVKAQERLKSLRNDYRKSGDPTYSSFYDRLAYVLAYHPGHIDMAVWSFEQSGAFIQSLDSRSSLNVTILGAGPGAELVALTKHLAENFPNLQTLNVTLVDRQSAWKELREIVSIPLARKQLGTCDLTVDEVKVDLLDEECRALLETSLAKADLVISHAVLSEVASCDGGDIAIDWLCERLQEGAPFLLVDLGKSPGGRAALERCANSGLKTLTYSTKSVPVGIPPLRLKNSLLTGKDGLKARASIEAAMTLMVRGNIPVLFPASTITFTQDQQQAIESFSQFLLNANSTPIAMLRGAAGTGKSTLLRELVRLAMTSGRSPRLVAPTGQASNRLSNATDYPSSTIHSALYLHNRTLLDEQGGREMNFGRCDQLLGDLLIVDEASLIGDTSLNTEEDAVRLLFNEGRVLTDLLDVLQLHRPELQILFVGDHHQLPPVADGNQRPALDPEILASRINTPVPVWELETVVRQAEGSPILAIATACRSGTPLTEQTELEEVSTSALSELGDELQNGTAVVIAYSNNTVARFNREIRQWWGRNNPHPQVGDRLVAIRNSMDLTFINGDEMIVESVGMTRDITRRLGKSDESATAHLLELVVSIKGIQERVLMDVLVLLDGIESQRRDTLDTVERVLTIDARARYREQYKNGDNGISETDFLRQDPTFNALRVIYPYARTCHRAQGGEWDTVIVDLSHGNTAQTGWDYTAVTRARKRLLVVNKARIFGPLKIDEELRPLIEQLGLRVDFQPLQHGAQQLTVQDDSTTVLINVYLKQGLPSKIARQHGDDDLWQRVNLVILKWGARVRQERQPITDPTAAERLSTLLESFDIRPGVQVTRRKAGNFEVEIEAIGDDGSTGLLRLGHNSAGVFKPKSLSGDGIANETVNSIQELFKH